MSSNRNLSSSSLIGTAIAASFLTGVGMSVYFMRVRDRERLRKAASRVKTTLRKQTQRFNLGPRFSTFSTTAHPKIIVVGAGNYGTAMAYTAARHREHEVILFMRDPEQCRCINEEGYNPKYLSKYPLTVDGNKITGICTKEDLAKHLQTPDVLLILALPCQKTVDWICDHRSIIPPNVLICSTAKGLYLKTKQLIGHAILDALDRAEQPLTFLSGPGFAEEIVKGHPTSVVVASDQLFLAVRVQRIMSNMRNFRVYTSQDPIGVQLGGALKNPLAVGAGMLTGMGFGINTLSGSVTRASRELCDLCIAMGGDPQTINGLSGIGDLVLTCFSDKSRNQRCGQRLIKGERIEDIQKDYTVEGVATADVAMVYAEMCGLELPLFSVVHALIHKTIDADKAVEMMMGRSLKPETDRGSHHAVGLV